MENKGNNRLHFTEGDMLDLIFGDYVAKTEKTTPNIAPESAFLDPEKFWLLDCVLISL